MKPLVVLMMSVFAYSSQADDFSCKEIYDVREEVLRCRISINITELKDITPANTNRNYDNAYEVKVTVKSTLQGKTTILKQITAKAIAEDVTYNINAKSQNLRFWMYMDEMDQSGIEFVDSRGMKRKVNLNCELL